MSYKLTKDEWYALVIGLVLLFTLMLMPARAHAQTANANCYRTKTGITCASGQAPAGGSGITPVKRWKN